VVLAAAKKGSALAEALGAASWGGGIDVDTEYRTSVDDVTDWDSPPKDG
jgi:hypothetical protein